jgi:hypothetical protein
VSHDAVRTVSIGYDFIVRCMKNQGAWISIHWLACLDVFGGAKRVGWGVSSGNLLNPHNISSLVQDVNKHLLGRLAVTVSLHLLTSKLCSRWQ